jgi:hypothetical protein
MLLNLDNTIYGKASRFVSIFAPVVDGSTSFLVSIPVVITFLRVPSVLEIHAFIMSIFASMLTLFSLGV